MNASCIRNICGCLLGAMIGYGALGFAMRSRYEKRQRQFEVCQAELTRSQQGLNEMINILRGFPPQNAPKVLPAVRITYQGKETDISIAELNNQSFRTNDAILRVLNSGKR